LQFKLCDQAKTLLVQILGYPRCVTVVFCSSFFDKIFPFKTIFCHLLGVHLVIDSLIVEAEELDGSPLDVYICLLGLLHTEGMCI
jgi:hypothetical protein